MYKSPALTAVLAVSAAALASCSSGSLEDAASAPEATTADQSSQPAATATTTATPAETSEPELIEDVSFENDWSEKQLRDYMEHQGANSLEAFSEGTPERNIVAVTNPDEGVVRFEVRDLDYEANDWFIDGLAVNYMLSTGCAAEDVSGVIVETEGGGDSAFQDVCH